MNKVIDDEDHFPSDNAGDKHKQEDDKKKKPSTRDLYKSMRDESF